MTPDHTSDALVVLVVDDHPVFLRGVVSLIQGQPWVKTVLVADSVASALAAVAENEPGLMILDVMLPERRGDEARPDGGFKVLRATRRGHPTCQVLMLSMATDSTLVQNALALGAQGYLAKDADPDLVLHATRTVAMGGFVMGQLLAETLRHEGEPTVERAPPPFDRLSDREITIVRGIARGCSNLAIAREVKLAEKTVRNAVSAILVKVGVPNRAALASKATQCGLTSD